MTVISSRVPVPNLTLGRSEPPLETGALLEGERLGQFLLEKFVGGGGMGVVFRALDTTLNREVAVKVLSRNQSADDETLRRFRNEAQSAARLNHENIAHVHYVGEDRGVHYIVFEYIEGVNIRDLVERNGPLPLEDALSYCYQIAQALEHASQRAVIHRDIKPSNVLITLDGKAKLVDMGLARMNQVAQADNDLTASGVTLGTFDYISPEQARDPRSADVRSDLYSLGCSFFYMLTGRPPFPDGTVLQKLLQHQADHPPDPRVVRPELPADVTRILARLLAKNPAHRYQQPGELSDDLSALGDKLGLQLSSSRPHWSPARDSGPMALWQQHLPWAVPLALLFLTVIALDFYWSSESAETIVPALPAAASRVLTPPRVADPPQITATPAADRLSPPARSSVETPQPGSADVAEDGAARAPSAGPAPPVAANDARPFWERVLEPFGAGKLNRLKDPVSDAAKEPVQSGRQSADVPTDPIDATAGSQPSAPRGPATTTAPGAARENLLVVGDDTAPRSYASLHAACGDAKSGDVIELRYDGRRVEKPIAISNTKLTIRAGERFQPVVVFRPDPALVPLKYPQTMLSIAGSQLYVTGVHWELDLPRNVPPDWALFETRGSELVQFQKCTFTIRNTSLGQTAYHAGVAFFDIKAPPGSGSMAIAPEAVEEQIVTVNLQHCLARGEAVFMRSNDLQVVHLNWDNGLLATSERLLVAAGGPTQPRQLGHVQINLRHVTAMTQLGLALLTNSEDAPYQLVTEINCDNSIFASAARVPLIEQSGSDKPQEYETRLQWSGNCDFFDGFDPFWQIVSTTTQTASKQMRFDAWQDHWGSQSRSQWVRKDIALWRGLAGSDRPFHAHAPADYALDSGLTNNPALGGASDGADAGCLLRQLPALVAADRAEARP
jgi:serine/threonine-protein kinase